MTITEMVNEAHKTAIDKGWWDNPGPITEQICLVMCECAEAVEELRKGKLPIQIFDNDGKPGGPGCELADAVIRIADICGAYGIDLELAIKSKMEYNKTRPYKHGKEF